MNSSEPNPSSSKKSSSDIIYDFVDNIKKSVNTKSTKISDLVSNNSPLLLTNDNDKISSTMSPKTEMKSPTERDIPLNKGADLDINSSLSPPSSKSSSWYSLGGLTNRIWIKVLLVIILLGFIGINIFIYLGFSIKKIYGILDKFVNTIKSILSGGKSKQKPNDKPNDKPNQKPKPNQKSPSLEKTMVDLVDEIEDPKSKLKKQEVKPDEDKTTIHTSAKSGYCNVGSWKGIRSCVKVSNANECISGDIFPTKDICINPSLRS